MLHDGSINITAPFSMGANNANVNAVKVMSPLIGKRQNHLTDRFKWPPIHTLKCYIIGKSCISLLRLGLSWSCQVLQ